jgi:hypothetical protein
LDLDALAPYSKLFFRVHYYKIWINFIGLYKSGIYLGVGVGGTAIISSYVVIKYVGYIKNNKSIY